MKKEDHIAKIDTYLLQQMSEEEQAQFEQAIANDAVLATEVAITRKEHEIMEAVLKEQLLSEMDTWEKEIQATNTPKIIPFYRKRWFTASIAASLLLIAGFFVLLQFNTSDQQQLALDYYEAANFLSGITRSSDTVESSSAYEDAIYLLEQFTEKDKAQLPKIIQILEAIPPTDERYEQTEYDLGNAYFRNGDYKKAVDCMKRVQRYSLITQNPNLSDKADYIILLALLADQREKVNWQALLEEMSSNHLYEKQALELYHKLK